MSTHERTQNQEPPQREKPTATGGHHTTCYDTMTVIKTSKYKGVWIQQAVTIVNIDYTLYSQKIPHTSPLQASYRVSIVSIL